MAGIDRSIKATKFKGVTGENTERTLLLMSADTGRIGAKSLFEGQNPGTRLVSHIFRTSMFLYAEKWGCVRCDPAASK